MRNTTTALLAAMLLSGAAYAQTAPAAPPATAPSTAVRPGVPTPPAAASPSATAPSAATAVASTPALAIGDVVELKSGSPHMTVIEIGTDVLVLWYTNEKGMQRERFPLAALEKTDLNEADEYAPAAAREGQPADTPRREESRGRDEHDDARMGQMERMHRHERMERDRRYDDRGRDRRYGDDDDDRYERQPDRWYGRR